MFISRTPKKELTVKQRTFLREFPKDLNATQAAIRAGYSQKTANEQGARLVKLLKQHIQERDQAVSTVVSVQAPRTALAPVSETELMRFIQQVERLVYFDVRTLFDTHGNPIEIPALSDEAAPAIAGFEFYEEFDGKGKSRKAVGYTKKFKLTDRIAALTLLAKLKGHYPEKHDRLQSPLEQAATATLLAMKEQIEQRQRERHSL